MTNMRNHRPTETAVSKATVRADSLPEPRPEPFSQMDLADPVKRFGYLVSLDEWVKQLNASQRTPGLSISPDPMAEVAELAPIVSKTPSPPMEPARLTSGPLAVELEKVDRFVIQNGGDRRPSTEPTFYFPEIIEAVERERIKMFCRWVVTDGRPDQTETNARHAWHNDPLNVVKFAELLGYTVSALDG